MAGTNRLPQRSTRRPPAPVRYPLVDDPDRRNRLSPRFSDVLADAVRHDRAQQRAARRWSAEVLLERARLALVDPEGEAEAVAPLSEKRAAAAIVDAILERRRRPPLRVVGAGFELPARDTGRSAAILAGLVRAVQRAAEGNRNAVLFWAARRAIEHRLPTGMASSALEQAGLDAGLGESEVRSTLRSAARR
jgi:hypothetical protein